MGLTLSEKIFARTGRAPDARAGDVVWAQPDLVTTPEVSFPAYMKRLRGLGLDTLAAPERIVVAIDHEVPAHSQAGADRNRLTRTLARDYEIGHLLDGEGITHPLIVERGLVRPGMFVAAADSHTAVIGGAGAIGIPFGFETALLMATGTIWVRVPHTIRVWLEGTLQPGVTARDVALATMRELDEDTASYCVLEFAGPGLAAIPFWDRMTLCGLCIDVGAKSAVVPADAACLAFYRDHGHADVAPLASDDDAVFAHEVRLDLARLAPLVSVPPGPTHVQPVGTLSTVEIQHAYLGSCASGTLADLRASARMLQGRQVRPGVHMLVIPSTRHVFKQAMAEGLLGRFLEAGAAVSAPTCGPCFGGIAQLCAGERRIATSTRNDPGRMGSPEAEIYLASALTVTASAIAGHIADPRQFMEG